VDFLVMGSSMQFPQLKRRELITLLCGAVAAWPRVLRAQQPAMPRVGFLCSATPQAYASRVTAFLKGLA
jgi:putative ABC transport system substrate-binding protein